MINNYIKKITITIAILAACSGIGTYYYYATHQGPIYEFNPVTDMQQVLAIFNQDFDWLTANKDSSPAFMFKNRTYDNNPIHFGTLKIKVLKENNTVAGFAAFYKETPQQGRLLFLAVGRNFRGKGYGEMLARHAMDELFKMGVEHLALWTRVDNLPAQRIYKRLGFVEKFDTEGFVWFEYHPNLSH